MEASVPQHVAIILDGNGRWAKAHGLPRNAGHAKGAAVVEDIVRDAWHLGIRYLTVYAFSTENWSRPEAEVSTLMKLIKTYIEKNEKLFMDENVRCRFIGERSRLSAKLQDAMSRLEELTSNNDGLQFSIAINYGSRDEITRAVRQVASRVADGTLAPEEITEQVLNDALDTGELPDPDLIIRTCNEQRLSNFLLWQAAYSEFYFTPVAWPDFSKEELEKAIAAYAARNRKFGGLKDAENGGTR